VNVIEVILVVS